MTEGGALREQLVRVRMDLTDAQGKLTEAFRQLDALGITEAVGTRYDRQLGKARQGIADGWWKLSPVMLNVELDLLGIAGSDRPALQGYAADCTRLNELAGPDNRARETSQVTHG